MENSIQKLMLPQTTLLPETERSQERDRGVIERAGISHDFVQPHNLEEIRDQKPQPFFCIALTAVVYSREIVLPLTVFKPK
jgi:hypothetical protein